MAQSHLIDCTDAPRSFGHVQVVTDPAQDDRIGRLLFDGGSGLACIVTAVIDGDTLIGRAQDGRPALWHADDGDYILSPGRVAAVTPALQDRAGDPQADGRPADDRDPLTPDAYTITFDPAIAVDGRRVPVRIDHATREIIVNPSMPDPGMARSLCRAAAHVADMPIGEGVNGYTVYVARGMTVDGRPAHVLADAATATLTINVESSPAEIGESLTRIASAR